MIRFNNVFCFVSALTCLVLAAATAPAVQFSTLDPAYTQEIYAGPVVGSLLGILQVNATIPAGSATGLAVLSTLVDLPVIPSVLLAAAIYCGAVIVFGAVPDELRAYLRFRAVELD